MANASAAGRSAGSPPGDFADVFQTRSRDQVQWSVAVKERISDEGRVIRGNRRYVRACVRETAGVRGVAWALSGGRVAGERLLNGGKTRVKIDRSVVKIARVLRV